MARNALTISYFYPFNGKNTISNLFQQTLRLLDPRKNVKLNYIYVSRFTTFIFWPSVPDACAFVRYYESIYIKPCSQTYGIVEALYD